MMRNLYFNKSVSIIAQLCIPIQYLQSKSMVKTGQKRKVICIKTTDFLFKNPSHQASNLTNVADSPAYLVEIRTELYPACRTASRYVLLSACLNKLYQSFHSARGDLLVELHNGFTNLCYLGKKSIGLFGGVLVPSGLIFCM